MPFSRYLMKFRELANIFISFDFTHRGLFYPRPLLYPHYQTQNIGN